MRSFLIRKSLALFFIFVNLSTVHARDAHKPNYRLLASNFTFAYSYFLKHCPDFQARYNLCYLNNYLTGNAALINA